MELSFFYIALFVSFEVICGILVYVYCYRINEQNSANKEKEYIIPKSVKRMSTYIDGKRATYIKSIMGINILVSLVDLLGVLSFVIDIQSKYNRAKESHQNNPDD